MTVPLCSHRFLPTPSARRATKCAGARSPTRHISTHALREEGDGRALKPGSLHFQFLPTPSARRATCAVATIVIVAGHFYPRPPRGGRLEQAEVVEEPANFYPRPPRGGRHPPDAHSRRHRGHFYPRPPRGGRRGPTASIMPSRQNFYPRPPRGGRPVDVTAEDGSTKFLPTPSARRATANVPENKGYFLAAFVQ